MSSSGGILEFIGSEFNILYLKHEPKYPIDSENPTSTAGTIQIVIEPNEEVALIEIILTAQFRPMEGKILCKQTGGKGKKEEITFKKAYITDFHTVEDDEKLPKGVSITFSAESIDKGEVKSDIDQ